MECPNCGDQLHEGARYCSKCGTRIRDRPTPSPAGTQASGPSMDRAENARVGYQATVSVWIAQTQLIWSRFNVMIVANSIILSAVGLTMGDTHPLSASFTRPLCLVGLVVSLAWLCTCRRACQLNNYLLSSVRELESYLVDPVATISRGTEFSKGKEVTLTIDGERTKLRLSWLARTSLAKTESFSYFLIAMFMLFYILLLFRF
jgi:hypothetical protein